MTRAIPLGYHSVTPMFIFKDAGKAIEFYKRAFGAQERFLMPGPEWKRGVMHAQVRVGDSIIIMGEEHPQNPCKSAETIGGSPVSFYVYLENVDEALNAAVAAGAEVRMAVQDMFWGDRMGNVQDPFGHSWSLATHTKDLTPEEIRQGAEALSPRCKGTSKNWFWRRSVPLIESRMREWGRSEWILRGFGRARARLPTAGRRFLRSSGRRRHWTFTA
jgi:PhnB protein